MRALVACGWFGIQAWIGGEALQVFFRTVIPGWPLLLGAGVAGHTTTEWLSFLLFWGLNVFIIYRGMNLLRAVENWAAPYVLVMNGRAALVGGCRKPTPRPAARAARQVPHVRGILGRCSSVAHGDDRFPGATLSLNMAGLVHALSAAASASRVIGRRGVPTTMSLFAANGGDEHQRDGESSTARRSWIRCSWSAKFSSAWWWRVSMFHGRRRDDCREHSAANVVLAGHDSRTRFRDSSASRPAG